VLAQLHRLVNTYTLLQYELTCHDEVSKLNMKSGSYSHDETCLILNPYKVIIVHVPEEAQYDGYEPCLSRTPSPNPTHILFFLT
jgi:hypothetical protein